MTDINTKDLIRLYKSDGISRDELFYALTDLGYTIDASIRIMAGLGIQSIVSVDFDRLENCQYCGSLITELSQTCSRCGGPIKL